jgi:MoxR-like ATPase
MVSARFDRNRRADLQILDTDSGPDETLGANYVVDEALEDAINVSLILGRPLLVTGAPGCGKTQLGYAIARNLGVTRLRFFSAKSTSEARDLFYSYDALGRYQAVQVAAAESRAGEEKPLPRVQDFIEYHVLGAAILDAHPRSQVEHMFAGAYHRDENLEPRRTVVIIDEIDKASRDFPNDLLDEIDRLRFRVPELLPYTQSLVPPRLPVTPGRSEIDVSVRPIVVITSNSEKQLPDAFMRRCVFAEMQFPSDDTIGYEKLEKIVTTALTQKFEKTDVAAVAAIRKLVFDFRRRNPLRSPGIAELLDAATYLSQARNETPNARLADLLRKTKPALVKEPEDKQIFDELNFESIARG